MAVLMATLIFLSGCTEKRTFPPGPVIDLTHSFDGETIYWSTEDRFKLERRAFGYTERGYFYSANYFCSPEHGGTHMDAPVHFAENQMSADEVPIERLIGRGVLIDVEAACASNRDYQVLIEDFTRWESRHGSLSEGSIVLLRTGFGKYWPDRKEYMGTDKGGKDAVMSFPGLHPETAQWLVSSRRIGAIGLDTPSIDFGQSENFQSHVILAKGNIPVFENVANLDQLPTHGFTVIALPMKIREGSGAPLRIIAVLDN